MMQTILNAYKYNLTTKHLQMRCNTADSMFITDSTVPYILPRLSVNSRRQNVPNKNVCSAGKCLPCRSMNIHVPNQCVITSGATKNAEKIESPKLSNRLVFRLMAGPFSLFNFSSIFIARKIPRPKHWITWPKLELNVAGQQKCIQIVRNNQSNRKITRYGSSVSVTSGQGSPWDNVWTAEIDSQSFAVLFLMSLCKTKSIRIGTTWHMKFNVYHYVTSQFTRCSCQREREISVLFLGRADRTTDIARNIRSNRMCRFASIARRPFAVWCVNWNRVQKEIIDFCLSICKWHKNIHYLYTQ